MRVSRSLISSAICWSVSPAGVRHGRAAQARPARRNITASASAGTWPSLGRTGDEGAERVEQQGGTGEDDEGHHAREDAAPGLSRLEPAVASGTFTPAVAHREESPGHLRILHEDCAVPGSFIGTLRQVTAGRRP
jgi:hypothetical protein